MNDNDFKSRARKHQVQFRNETLRVGYDTYVTWLRRADAERGLNFFEGFEILTEVKDRYPSYRHRLYADTLRSEHIPFNFFIPFKSNPLFCREVLNEVLGIGIKSVSEIKVEYAPTPAAHYLNDRTSFDVYVEYILNSGERGFVGIEVKYTERESTRLGLVLRRKGTSKTSSQSITP